jgi:DMSO/TMAO reductase YedYZ molybdopterin-dependent catalytic subunit
VRTSRRGAAAVASRDAAAAEFAARSATTTPTAGASAGVATAAQLDVPGLSPFFTPNKDFYRIDTALSVPEIDAKTWSLRIHGMVDTEVQLSYAQLLAMPAVEHDVTLACVSNPVGGDLISNARWTGVPLSDVLALAGVQPGATQLITTSADGWTAGTPTAVVTDGRAAMLAYGMNGEPLPLAHGFPVRIVVPGLYGYVSATKWLVDIELTTMEAEGYWIPRGWSKDGPVKTQSRIDVPNGKNPARVGRTPIAGVAWSQHKGIDKVEVSIDDGPWLEARLAGEDVTDTWRQWIYDGWDATPGRHTLRVRATDRSGYVQTGDHADVAPDGATGYHERQVQVH